MAIKIGTIEVTGVAVGETSIGSVAVGSNFVWQKVIPDPLCFTGTSTDSVRMTKVGNPDEANIEYSKDGNTWTAYTFGTWIDFDGADHKVYFRAASNNNISFNTDDNNRYKFELDENSPTTISGNINTLFKKDGSIGVEGKSRCFRDFFDGCNIVDASQLELPSTTLATQCYYGMFHNCASLSAAPALPATTLGNRCYGIMFQNCTSLTQAPELPATTLIDNCYNGMFQGCTSLVQAPELPSTTLAPYCYYSMFRGCSSLSSITVGFSDWQAASSTTTNWVNGVAASGDFNCPAELSVVRGASNIPTNWAVTPLTP